MNSTLIISDDYKTNLENNLKDKLNVSQISLYNPIMENLLHDTSFDENYIFKSKYFIHKLLENTTENKESQDTPYIKRNFISQIKHNYSSKFMLKEIFIKVNPILDVISYILDEYETKNSLLPNYNSNYTSNYIKQVQLNAQFIAIIASFYFKIEI